MGPNIRLLCIGLYENGLRQVMFSYVHRVCVFLEKTKKVYSNAENKKIKKELVKYWR